MHRKLTDSVELFTRGLNKQESPYHEVDDPVFNQRIASILKEAGMQTYENVLDYARYCFFSDLPGIDVRTAEMIHKHIEYYESIKAMDLNATAKVLRNSLNALGEHSQQLSDDAKGIVK